MAELEAKAQLVATELGIELVDVRVSRIELPEDVSESVYQRMRAERSRTAKDFRARGKETAENIKAQADKKRTVIIAEAYRTSEQEKVLAMQNLLQYMQMLIIKMQNFMLLQEV